MSPGVDLIQVNPFGTHLALYTNPIFALLALTAIGSDKIRRTQNFTHTSIPLTQPSTLTTIDSHRHRLVHPSTHTAINSGSMNN